MFLRWMFRRPHRREGDAGQQRQVFFHDHDLGAEIDRRSNVQRIAGEDHKVELGCGAEQPIELRQRILQIGHHQTAHVKSNPNA